MEKIAVIRIKGDIGLKKEIRDTFRLLKLYKKNSCIVMDNTPSNTGMLRIIQDNATWGEINKDILKQLLSERGRIAGNKKMTEDYLKEKLKVDLNQFADDLFNSKKKLKDLPGLKLFFRLKPPEKGFERKGIKVPFSLGGALGYRKDKINDLIKKML